MTYTLAPFPDGSTFKQTFIAGNMATCFPLQDRGFERTIKLYREGTHEIPTGDMRYIEWLADSVEESLCHLDDKHLSLVLIADQSFIRRFMCLPNQLGSTIIVGSVNVHEAYQDGMLTKYAPLFSAEARSWENHLFDMYGEPLPFNQQNITSFLHDVINTGTPLIETGIPDHLIQRLLGAKVRSIEEINQMTDRQLQLIRGIKDSSVETIREAITAYENR